MKSWFIKGNVVSSKNNRMWTGKYSIPSKQYMEYKKQAKPQFEAIKEEFLQESETMLKPLHINFYYYRWTKHKADAHNLCQGPLDIMTELGLIPDDNMDEILVSFSGYEIVPKEKAGLKITLLDNDK